MITEIFIAALFGYLLGSIPMGLLITRAAGIADIRNTGSGNIGATNVLRAGDAKLAVLTLLADILKGWLPVFLISYFYGLIPCAVVAGVAAILGHMYPVWLKFKGGKGVATYIGVALGFSVNIGLLFVMIWLLVAYFTRYSSLSALIAALLTPLFSIFLSGTFIAAVLFALSGLIFFRHKLNIKRLIEGTEPKIGQSVA